MRGHSQFSFKRKKTLSCNQIFFFLQLLLVRFYKLLPLFFSIYPHTSPATQPRPPSKAFPFFCFPSSSFPPCASWLFPQITTSYVLFTDLICNKPAIEGTEGETSWPSFSSAAVRYRDGGVFIASTSPRRWETTGSNSLTWCPMLGSTSWSRTWQVAAKARAKARRRQLPLRSHSKRWRTPIQRRSPCSQAEPPTTSQAEEEEEKKKTTGWVSPVFIPRPQAHFFLGNRQGDPRGAPGENPSAPRLFIHRQISNFHQLQRNHWTSRAPSMQLSSGNKARDHRPEFAGFDCGSTPQERQTGTFLLAGRAFRSQGGAFRRSLRWWSRLPTRRRTSGNPWWKWL